MFVLTRFPLPPSSNQLYASVRGRLIKSMEGRKYDNLVQLFKLKKFKELDRIQKELNDGSIINIETIFVFTKNRIIGKKGQVKKLDTSNRIKTCHDGLAKILEIDDSLFKSMQASTATCLSQQDEQVIVVLSKSQIKTLEEIKQNLNI